LPEGRAVTACFDAQYAPGVAAALQHDVIVSGMVQGYTDDGQIAELCLEAIEPLEAEALDEPADTLPPARSAAELIERLTAVGVIGIWGDRADIGDSTEFATRLRRRAEAHRNT